MLGASNEYRKMIRGLKPDAKKHQTFVDVQSVILETWVPPHYMIFILSQLLWHSWRARRCEEGRGCSSTCSWRASIALPSPRTWPRCLCLPFGWKRSVHLTLWPLAKPPCMTCKWLTFTGYSTQWRNGQFLQEETHQHAQDPGHCALGGAWRRHRRGSTGRHLLHISAWTPDGGSSQIRRR